MEATHIVPQRDNLVDWMTCEIESLAAEIFASTPHCDWQRAIDEALVSVVDLLDYAEEYDHLSAIEHRQQREIDLMVQTKCSAADAIDAIRVADGRPRWAEVVS